MTRVTHKNEVLHSITVKKDEVPEEVMTKICATIDTEYPMRPTFSYCGEYRARRKGTESVFYQDTLGNLV